MDRFLCYPQRTLTISGNRKLKAMNRKVWSITFCACFLILVSACTKRAQQVIVEVPAGFNGNFVLEMGVTEAPPLEKRGNAYVVTVPRSGRVPTSTLLTDPTPMFQNASSGVIWGYSHSISTTGDGIPVGGRIEFFVGTRKEYEAEQGRKKHSKKLSNLQESIRV